MFDYFKIKKNEKQTQRNIKEIEKEMKRWKHYQNNKFYLFVSGNELILAKGDIMPNSHNHISRWFWSIDDAMLYCAKYNLHISRFFGNFYNNDIDITAHADNCISIKRAK